ncbi:MAG: hypothetical protein AAGG68_08920 [Bacteroidota bacterium]
MSKLVKTVMAFCTMFLVAGAIYATCCVQITSTPCPGGGCGDGDPKKPHLALQFNADVVNCTGDCPDLHR